MTPVDTSSDSKRRLARGLNASPGRATGGIVFEARDAIAAVGRGDAVILVRVETSSEDIEGMKVAAGILTTRGGLTADAAIVARSLGKPCIAGCTAVHVDYRAGTMSVAVEDETRRMERVTLRRGDIITIDGTTGDVFAGA